MQETDESTFLADIDKLAAVHAFRSNEQFFVLLKFVGVAEMDFRNWGAAARVMNDFTDDSSQISRALSIVDGAKFCSANAMCGVGSKNGTATFTLG